MARRSTSTTTPAAARPKRLSGYVVTIKGFVPAGVSYPERRAVLDAMEAAENGDASATLALLQNPEITTKLTTKTLKPVTDAAG